MQVEFNDTFYPFYFSPFSQYVIAFANMQVNCPHGQDERNCGKNEIYDLFAFVSKSCEMARAHVFDRIQGGFISLSRVSAHWIDN